MKTAMKQSKPIKIVFLVLPKTHLMDLAGPDQAFLEAIGFGAPLSIEYCSYSASLCTSVGLPFGKLKHFSKVKFNEGDFVIVPGADLKFLQSREFKSNAEIFAWLRNAYERRVNVCSVCSGAFVLAESGLLNGKKCTTHWKRTAELKELYPNANVQENILYTVDNGIYTSAGIASGIDMALHILEQLQGAYFAYKVAREMVIYTRRNGDEMQQSEFLAYRNHIHAGIHAVQDWVSTNLHKRISLEGLADVACMSDRNLTRIFKKETGLTVNEYVNALRRERIRQLLKNPDLTRKQIARQCGLTSERQISRIVHNK
jgi:transcriptional regulator GlxA family with amidase domain